MKSDAELIADGAPGEITSARILVPLVPGQKPPAPRADLGEPEPGWRWETDAEFAARLRAMEAAAEF